MSLFKKKCKLESLSKSERKFIELREQIEFWEGVKEKAEKFYSSECFPVNYDYLGIKEDDLDLHCLHIYVEMSLGGHIRYHLENAIDEKIKQIKEELNSIALDNFNKNIIIKNTKNILDFPSFKDAESYVKNIKRED